MPSTGREEHLRSAERELQAAQLASDVAVLDRLIDDTAIFAGPDGSLLGKSDDLAAHCSGRQRLHRVQELDLQLRVVGSTGVTCLLADLEGAVADQPFAARVRYTRTWAHDEPTDSWRVLAAQATIVGS